MAETSIVDMTWTHRDPTDNTGRRSLRKRLRSVELNDTSMYHHAGQNFAHPSLFGRWPEIRNHASLPTTYEPAFNREASRTISPEPVLSPSEHLPTWSSTIKTKHALGVSLKPTRKIDDGFKNKITKRKAVKLYKHGRAIRALRISTPVDEFSGFNSSNSRSRKRTSLQEPQIRAPLPEVVPSISPGPIPRMSTIGYLSVDDEDDSTTSQQYRESLNQLKSREIQSDTATRNVIEIEDLESDEGEDIEDNAPFSALPSSLQGSDEISITAQRKVQSQAFAIENVDRVSCNGISCAPGKCVELKDGSFIRVENIQRRNGANFFIRGLLFQRHNAFNDTKWPRRHNEVVQISKVEKNQLVDSVTRPLSQVSKVRNLILTNQTFPKMSSRDHPDRFPNVQCDIKNGPLFCRWKHIHVLDDSGKVIEESIQKLSFAMSDAKGRIDDSEVRLEWRGRSTARGGEHTFVETTIDETGHRSRTARKYVLGDIFCGGGGASCAADLAGLFVKFGVDLNEKAMQTYQRNFAHKNTRCLHMDIHDFIKQNIASEDLVDILHMSPPCQPFSPAHTVLNQLNDERNEAAMFSVFELIVRLKPRIATLEETLGLFNRHPVWFNALIKMFLDHGYSVRWKCAKLEEYGLPQKRRRLIIIAAGPGEALPPFPTITHSESNVQLKGLATIHDTIDRISTGQGITHHDIRAATFPSESVRSPYSARTQAKTVTCGGGIGNHHPSGTRQFTIRELAALQMFPMTYKFAGNGTTALKKQIGNAVPPLVFRRIFQEIIASLRKTDGVQ